MATSLDALILFRVLQGLAGGGLQPSSQGILLDAFPREKHGTAMTLFAMAALLAVLLAGGCTPQQNASATRVIDSAVVSNAPAAPAETSGTATAAEPSGITVTATGTVSMKPDVAQIQLGVQTTANTADAARKSNGGAMTKVMDALKANGGPNKPSS